MDNAVALAAIGFAGTSLAALVWVVKYLANTLSKDIREHTMAAVASTTASEAQTKASNEVLEFMRNLNGKLTGAVKSKIKE